MAKKKPGGVKQKNKRKFGRQKRKMANRGSAISLFVRDKITAEQYFKLTNQAVKAR